MEASRHPRQSHQSHQRAPRDVSFLGTFIQRPREGVCGFPIKCLGGRPSKCTEQTTLSRSSLLGASASILAALGSRPRDCSRCLGRCQREDPRAGLTAGKDPREGGIKTRLSPPGRVSTRALSGKGQKLTLPSRLWNKQQRQRSRRRHTRARRTDPGSIFTAARRLFHWRL